ncbi:hypothetical protein ACFL6H_08240 [Candidatus Latescibacterota bacterium]
MPIQNVNAANNAYQVVSKDNQQEQQNNPEVNQNTKNITQEPDALIISSDAEKLQTENRLQNNESQGENEANVIYPDQNPDEEQRQTSETEFTGIARVAVREERPVEDVNERDVQENRVEQLQRQEQIEKSATDERNARNRKSILDLTA